MIKKFIDKRLMKNDFRGKTEFDSEIRRINFRIMKEN